MHHMFYHCQRWKALKRREREKEEEEYAHMILCKYQSFHSTQKFVPVSFFCHHFASVAWNMKPTFENWPRRNIQCKKWASFNVAHFSWSHHIRDEREKWWEKKCDTTLQVWKKPQQPYFMLMYRTLRRRPLWIISADVRWNKIINTA